MSDEVRHSIETHDGPMPTFEARPDGNARGGIVVVQEAFGVTTHIEDIARRLADAGWLAIAPAFFHRQGSPVLAYDDFGAIMPLLSKLTAGGLATDLAASYDYLLAAGFSPGGIGLVGFCMGGSVTLYGATLRALGGAVTFYGGGVAEGRFGLPSLIDLAPSIETPWLGLYGDRDHSIPVADVERLRAAAAKAPVETEIVRYPEADHGFNCNDRPNVYDPAASADAWSRTLEWFDRFLSR